MILKLFVFALVLSETVQVGAVECENDNDCVATNNVQQKCGTTTPKKCLCKAASFVESTFGCIDRTAPAVKHAEGKSEQVVVDAAGKTVPEVKLTCSHDDKLTNVVYSWEVKGADKKITTKDYIVAPGGTIADDLTAIKCGIKSDEYPAVKQSPAVTFDKIDKATPKLKQAPTVVGGPYASSLPGANPNGAFKCTGIPYGTKLSEPLQAFKSGLIDIPTSFKADSSDYFTQVACAVVLEGTPATPVKDTGNTDDYEKVKVFTAGGATLATDLTAATTTLTPRTTNVEQNEKATLTCKTNYLLKGLKDVKYEFEEQGATPPNVKTSEEGTFDVPTDKTGDKKYKCRAVYKTKNSVDSSEVTVKVQAALKTPEIVPDRRQDGTKTDRVTLECSTTDKTLAGITYSWTYKGKTLYKQNDVKIQTRNVKKDDEGDFVCTVSRLGFKSKSSKPFILKSAAVRVTGSLTAGQKAEFTCTADAGTEKDYTWNTFGVANATCTEKDNKCTIDKLPEELSAITCSINGVTSIGLKIRAPKQPTVKPDFKVKDEVFVSNSDYKLTCDSPSFKEKNDDRVKYTWTGITATGKVYTISKISKDYAKNVTCTVSYEFEDGAVSSPASPKLVITVDSKEGQYCNADSDCKEDDYTKSSCKDKRCECNGDGKIEGRKCVSSGVTTMASIILLATAVFVTKFL